MFDKNYYKAKKAFKCTSKFGTPRKYGKLKTFHAGVDYVSKNYKHQDIYNLIDGVIHSIRMTDFTYAGKHIILKHNLKYIGGVNDVFYSCYKHMNLVHLNVNEHNFVKHGKIIGKMGNTGYCMTFDNGWRPITDAEKDDMSFNGGVHLHCEFYQKASDITKLLKELVKLNLISKNQMKNIKEVINYFYRGNKLYINPGIIMQYARMLQNDKSNIRT